MVQSGLRVLRLQTRNFTSRWKQQRDADIFANRAIKEGMRSRAAYKLEEMNKRFGNFLRQVSFLPFMFVDHEEWQFVKDLLLTYQVTLCLL